MSSSDSDSISDSDTSISNSEGEEDDKCYKDKLNKLIETLSEAVRIVIGKHS